MLKTELFDSTLRDGAQSEGVSFSVQDKLKILQRLDAFGIDYIEAGNPGSNPKDLEFFEKARNLKLENAKLVAFGSTKRKFIKPEEDDNLNALLTAETDYVAIFGKSWDLHVDIILSTTLEENLEMIRQTIKYMTEKGKTVFFDAEHFFDGYKANPDYAVKTLKTAAEAGAVTLVLCDTNGGCFPDEITVIIETVKEAIKDCGAELGIHCHNDSGCAVANSLAAVKAGARQIQGTFIGIGERCGNANLSTIIANMQTKLGYEIVPDSCLSHLTGTAQYIAEIANMALPSSMPYVGSSAFAHKGGMHVDGVAKAPQTFEHINPEKVGNERNFLLSEVSGRSALLSKLHRIESSLDKASPVVKALTDKIKVMEHEGFLFEAADASFELLVLKELNRFNPFFEIIDFRIISSHSNIENGYAVASAMIKVKVGERYEITADEGDGPVNAIDRALRKALEVFYPALSGMRLSDFKVRVIDTEESTAATTRVLIESTDGKQTWTTVGASKDIINASMRALTDSLEYMLYLNSEYNYNN